MKNIINRRKNEEAEKEFQVGYDRNPIKDISSRVKSPESILEIMERKNNPNTMRGMMNHIYGIVLILPAYKKCYILGQIVGFVRKEDGAFC